MKDVKERIRKWLENGKIRHSTHVIITYNNTERDIRPEYVNATQNVRTRIQSVNEDYNLRPIEVYNLSMDFETQLAQAKTWNT